MYLFFESTIRPLLQSTRVSVMVEVGAEAGEHTRKLLPYAQSRGAHLHVIDPVPRFSPKWFREHYASCATLYVQLSHDALPLIDSPDVVFLDGDHNWYSVLNELRILDNACREWPLTFLHDVEWPYGRRDMYYAPELVPAECRQPYARSGIVRGMSELSRTGVNARLANATHEGGPRNGVLTGIEDFLDETQRDLGLFIAPGQYGLAILVDRNALRKRRFARALRKVHDAQAGAALSPHHASDALA